LAVLSLVSVLFLEERPLRTTVGRVAAKELDGSPAAGLAD